MRMTQYVGTHYAAASYIIPSKDISNQYPENKTSGMFDEDVPLGTYEMPDGRIVEEYVQASPWSSGMMIFTALRFKDTKQVIQSTLWNNDEYMDHEVDYENGKFYV